MDTQNGVQASASSNTLYYGDCLNVLPKIPEQSVDLIYLDPPFNSKANYNVLYEAKKDRAQVEAFSDTWTWGSDSKTLYNTLSANPIIGGCVRGLKSMLGESGILNYLMYMAARLLLMRDVLKETGSMYLHCDPHASHYLKMVMDAVFGKKNFRNEIIWFYSDTPGRSKAHFPKKHDVLFFYTKCDDWYFSPFDIQIPIKKESKKRYEYIRKLGGKKYLGGNEGKIPESVWRIPAVKQNSRQALGYPTQKPLALLERIISASCPKDGVVLDPFCGCGTTVSAAEKLNRKWIGIDISYLAADLTKKRLEHEYKGKYKDIHVIGSPKTIDDAERLLAKVIKLTYGIEPTNVYEAELLAKSKNMSAKHKSNSGRFEFQRWVCGILSAFPNDCEIGDGGVDGTLLWRGGGNGEVVDKWGAVEVKSSKQVTPTQLNALKGVISNGGDYTAGILVSMLKTDTPEIREICSKFDNPFWQHQSYEGSFPKLQTYSVEEYFDGKKPNLPTPFPIHKVADIIGKRKQQMPVPF